LSTVTPKRVRRRAHAGDLLAFSPQTNARDVPHSRRSAGRFSLEDSPRAKRPLGQSQKYMLWKTPDCRVPQVRVRSLDANPGALT
jgi:hypothetical protein